MVLIATAVTSIYKVSNPSPRALPYNHRQFTTKAVVFLDLSVFRPVAWSRSTAGGGSSYRRRRYRGWETAGGPSGGGIEGDSVEGTYASLGGRFVPWGVLVFYGVEAGCAAIRVRCLYCCGGGANLGGHMCGCRRLCRKPYVCSNTVVKAPFI